jgi:hypothetical protein
MCSVLMSLVFLVPFEEDEKDPSVWYLDHNYVEAMNDMFKKVNGRYIEYNSISLEMYVNLLTTFSKGKDDRLVSQWT